MDDLFDDLWSVQSPTPDDRVSTRLLTDPQQLAALDKIEKVFECIVDSLANNDKQLTILLKRKDNNTLLRRIVTVTSPTSIVVMKKRICFPGRSPQDAWRFSQKDRA